MRLAYAFLCIQLLIKSFSGSLYAQSDIYHPLIPPNALQEDLSLLKSMLFETHTQPNAYVSQDHLDSLFAEVEQDLNQPMSALQFFKRINPILVSLKDIHSRLWLSPIYNEYLQQGGYFLPLKIHYLNQRIFVLNDEDPYIEKGAELLAINRIPISQITEKLLSVSYTDAGADRTQELLMEEEFFGNLPLYFYVDSINTLSIAPYQGADTIDILYPGIQHGNAGFTPKHRSLLGHNRPAIEVNFFEQERTALLRIKSFAKGKDQHYKRFLRKFFKALSETQTQSLIIDIRGNKGGYINRGPELLKYISPSPYLYVHNSIVRSSKLLRHKVRQSTAFPNLSLFFFRRSFGKELVAGWKNNVGTYDTLYWNAYPTLKDRKRFQGEVYLLVNPLSISNAALFHQVVDRYDIATTVGEASGSARSGTFGHSADFLLPNSHISGRISTIRLNSLSDDFQTVSTPLAPDYTVQHRLEDLIMEKDTQVEFILELIREKYQQRLEELADP